MIYSIIHIRITLPLSADPGFVYLSVKNKQVIVQKLLILTFFPHKI